MTARGRTAKLCSRNGLMLSCAVVAIVAVSGTQQAKAQAFRAMNRSSTELPAAARPPQPQQQGTGSEVVLGAIAIVADSDSEPPDDSDDCKRTAVNTSIALIGGATGIASDLVDEAVASGGDTTQWIHDDDPDDKKDK